MTGDLLQYAQGSPLLLAVLVAGTALVAFVERVFALTGPVTKLVGWWQGRELAKLRRAAVLRAEQRRIEQEEESGKVAALRAEVDWLRAEVDRLRIAVRCTCDDTAPMRSARNPPRLPVPRR